MAAFLYPTRGYSAGSWQGPASAIHKSNGSSFDSLAGTKKSAFYHNGSAWKRFYAGMPNTGQGHTSLYSGSRSASWQMNTDGTTVANATGSITLNNWWDEAGQPDIGDWEVYADVVTDYGGSSGTFGSWIDLTSNRLWQVSGPSGTERLLSFVAYLRHKPSGVQPAYIEVNLALGSLGG